MHDLLRAYICTNTHTNMHAYIPSYTCMHTYIHTYTCLCMCCWGSLYRPGVARLLRGLEFVAFSKFIRFGGVEGWGICASQVRNEMFQQLLAYGCRRFGDYRNGANLPSCTTLHTRTPTSPVAISNPDQAQKLNKNIPNSTSASQLRVEQSTCTHRTRLYLIAMGLI